MGKYRKSRQAGTSADSRYFTLSDGTMIISEKYQDELWKSGEGLFLTGPGIPEGGIKPVESVYADYSAYFEEYGTSVIS